ncbi:MAG: hypothetical protein KGO02_17920, partial [Alphaproteobacteria bacterium]|nr:hypothetical protein [Alphaproteobacteria bacterium]
MSKQANRGSYRAEDLKFASVYNDIAKFSSIGAVAKELGLSPQTVKNRAVELRKRRRDDPKKFPELAYRNNPPLSEYTAKFREDFGKEECLAELRRVAEIDPDVIVTRNYFRVHSQISESTWNRWFGTFEEYKRQAGIKLSRAQHAHERHIAKHASVDQYRELTSEKRNWDDRYVRENGSRFKTLVIGSDFHDVEIDPFFLRVWIDVIRRVQPDNVVFGGDVFDLP